MQMLSVHDTDQTDCITYMGKKKKKKKKQASEHHLNTHEKQYIETLIYFGYHYYHD